MIDPTPHDSTGALIATLLADSSRDELLQLLNALGPAKVVQWLSLVEPEDIPGLLERVAPEALAAFVSRLSSPRELKHLIDIGRDSDEVIETFGRCAGISHVLDHIFELAGTRLLPDRIAGDNGTVAWHINTPDGVLTYHLIIKDGHAQGGPGPTREAPVVTVSIDYADFIRLSAGLLDGLSAFMSDRIEVSGDMIFGARLSSAFDTTGGSG